HVFPSRTSLFAYLVGEHGEEFIFTAVGLLESFLRPLPVGDVGGDAAESAGNSRSIVQGKFDTNEGVRDSAKDSHVFLLNSSTLMQNQPVIGDESIRHLIGEEIMICAAINLLAVQSG